MSPIITYMILIFMALYGLITIIELIIVRKIKRFFYEILILIGFIIILKITTDFPFVSTKKAFGNGVSPSISIGIMFICIIIGMAARYCYYELGNGEKFSLRSFLKPLFISPIVLLPLIGSINITSDIESIQMISFGILAFQNGFFWKVVFERAEKTL